PPDRSLRVRVLERDADPRHELAKQHLVVGGTALTAETPELQAADHTSRGCELVRVGRRSHVIAGRRQGDQADPIARAAGEAHAADPELLLEQADHRARQLALVVPVRELTPEPVQRLEPARLLGEQQAPPHAYVASSRAAAPGGIPAPRDRRAARRRRRAGGRNGAAAAWRAAA